MEAFPPIFRTADIPFINAPSPLSEVPMVNVLLLVTVAPVFMVRLLHCAVVVIITMLPAGITTTSVAIGT